MRIQPPSVAVRVELQGVVRVVRVRCRRGQVVREAGWELAARWRNLGWIGPDDQVVVTGDPGSLLELQHGQVIAAQVVSATGDSPTWQS